jgi:hypothetical protein
MKKKYQSVLIFSSLLLIGTIPFAVQAKTLVCSEVVEQLRQMKAAQTSVQESLISNHEMMADSLESYSEAISGSAGRAYKSISENIDKAAVSLKQRSLKARNISKNLESNTDDLIKSVEKCLK